MGNGGLELHGETTFRSAPFAGSGVALFYGVARVVDDQTINLSGTFDLEGQNNDAQLIAEDGKTFNLQASSVNFGNNEFNGDILLTNGALIVDVDANVWTMAGELLMTGLGGSGVAGDAIEFNGDLIASGGPTQFVATSSRMLPSSSTSVAFGTRLQYNAPVTYEGGNHAVVGEVAYLSSATINGGRVQWLCS